MPEQSSSVNLLSLENLIYPYPAYEQLQAEAPFYWLEAAQGWMALRYVDVKQLSDDRRALGMKNIKPVSEQYVVAEHGLRINEINTFFGHWLLMKNPPDHTKLRNIMNRGFKPAIIRNLRSDIQEIVDDLLKMIEGNEDVSFMHDFAHHFPLLVIAKLLGVPRSDAPILLRWGQNVIAFIGDQTTEYTSKTEVIYQLMAEMRTYIKAMIDERRQQPREDLISVLTHTEINSELMGDEELISNCMMLLVAGYENSQNLIANGLLALLENPDQFDKLLKDPTLMPSVIEEIFRYYCSALMSMRDLGEDMEVGGRPFKAGERFFLMFGAANRDPRQFKDPHKFDITRNPNAHLGLGQGIHFCLGAPLARLQMDVAYTTLFRRWRKIETVLDKPDWVPNLMYQFMDKFPIKVEWAS